MKLFKFLFSHPTFLFYFIVMLLVILCICIDPYSFIDAPIAIKIAMTITIIGGCIGMGILLNKEYKASQA